MSEHDFGQKLRQLRHARGETLEDVSAATGLSVAMLSRVERGERLPSPDSVEALARHFELPADELLSETIAHKVMNRYGREWGGLPSARTWAEGSALDAGSANPQTPGERAPARGFADMRTPAEEVPATEFAKMRTRAEGGPSARVADMRTPAEGDPAAPAAPPPARAPLPTRTAGTAFVAQPIEALFGEEAARDQLDDAARVAEVALESAMRAVRRALASGDPRQVEEAERVLDRLRAALGG